MPLNKAAFSDADAPAASELTTATAAMLGRAASPALARAIAIAAARELEEETGLTLGAPPDLAGLRYLCRAVTPAGGTLTAHARVTKPGRRVAYADGDVRDASGAIVATASGSCLIIGPAS